MSTPLLTDLIAAYGANADYDPSASQLPVTSVTADSREVKPGAVFVALPGTKADGRQFIPQAIAAGASAIVSTDYQDPKVPTVRLANPRLALSRFAAALYAPQPEYVTAVTGTDGKTSTADFFRQLSERLGKKAASIGTLGTLGAHREELAPGFNTTPDPVALHRTLAELAQKGYDYACMEASSHGLHQYRLDGVRISAAAFTNLTRDHLDYHGTMENYFEAKTRLFSELLPDGGTAVLNSDDPHSVSLEEIIHHRGIELFTYGREGHDFTIVDQRPLPHGQDVKLKILGEDYHFSLQQVGVFQVYNMLAALGLLAGTGVSPKDAVVHLPQLQGVPGRLEPVTGHPLGAGIYIDYAHTPAALANVLRVLRPHTQKRLIVMFGCGGDRDRGKRPQMGKAAHDLAELVIVTDDNPRSENPAAIRAEVLAGCPGAKEVADRRDAIYGAVGMLSEGDVLLVAGKGHEKTQTVGDVVYPFDDVAVVKEALQGL